MAMPQDLVGRYIEYTIDMGGGAGAADHGKVITTQTTSATVNVYNAGLVRTGAPWTFTYLKYVPGAVTVATLGGPVMTGPLSGCYIFKYTQGGQKVAHVGTANTAIDPGTVAAKTAWKTLVAAPTVSNVTGSSPFHSFSVIDFKNAMIEGSMHNPICVGYYAGGMSYAMLLSRVPAINLPPVNRGLKLLLVSSVKQMDMQSWATIQAGPKFT